MGTICQAHTKRKFPSLDDNVPYKLVRKDECKNWEKIFEQPLLKGGGFRMIGW